MYARKKQFWRGIVYFKMYHILKIIEKLNTFGDLIDLILWYTHLLWIWFGSLMMNMMAKKLTTTCFTNGFYAFHILLMQVNFFNGIFHCLVKQRKHFTSAELVQFTNKLHATGVYLDLI